MVLVIIRSQATAAEISVLRSRMSGVKGSSAVLLSLLILRLLTLMRVMFLDGTTDCSQGS